MKKNVYIETSIISYLTGRASRNLLAVAWQTLTIEWWGKRRKAFNLFTSELVLEEARRGDKLASKKRIEVLKEIPLLKINDSAIYLAKKLIDKKALPINATDDALHISIATVHNIDYLLTWNCRHLDNAEIKPLIRDLISKEGLICPEICTPQELLGE